jgi:hypothetical protein
MQLKKLSLSDYLSGEWKATPIAIQDKLKGRLIANLPVSVRLRNILRYSGCRQLGDLEKLSIVDVWKQRTCGKKTITELISFLEGQDQLSPPDQGEDAKINIPPETIDLPLRAVSLSVRLRNVLKDVGCVKVGDLRDFSLNEISKARSCGRKTIDELGSFVAGLSQRQDRFVSQETTSIYIPERSRGWSLSSLPMSVRLQRLLASHGFASLGDLHGLDDSSIKWRGFGRTSWRELISIVREVQSGTFELPAGDAYQLVAHLIYQIDRKLGLLPARQQTVVVDRCNDKTLDEVAKKFSLTRERIRQIERISLKAVRMSLGPVLNYCADVIRKKLLDDVVVISPQLVDKTLSAQSRQLFFPTTVCLSCLSRIVDDIPILTTDHHDRKPTTVDRRLAAEITRQLKLSQTPLALNQLYNRLPGSIKDSGPKDFLVFMSGHSPTDLDLADPMNPKLGPVELDRGEAIRAVLREAKQPLTVAEIIDRGKAYSIIGDHSQSLRALEAFVLRDEDIYLLGPATFGLREHFRLAESDWPNVRKDFKRFMRKKGRPVSTIEFLQGAAHSWGAVVNHYELVHVIRQDPAVNYLGRMNFSLRSSGIRERVPLKQIMYQTLQNASGPLSSAEIYRALLKVRFVSPTSVGTMLRSNKRIFDLGFGYFSTKSRRIPSSYWINNAALISRMVARSEPPLRFGELLSKFLLRPNSPEASLLMKSLLRSKSIRVLPSDDLVDRLIVHRAWKLERYVYAILGTSDRPMSVHEIQWALNDRFKETFTHVKIRDLRKILMSSHKFVQPTPSEFALSNDLSRYGEDIPLIIDSCKVILRSSRAIVGCEDLLERLQQDFPALREISASMLSAILRTDEAFHEVGKNCFRVKA